MLDCEASPRSPKRACLINISTNVTTSSSIAKLTVPVLIAIVALLDPQSLACIQATCRRFYHLIDQNHHKLRKFRPHGIHIRFRQWGRPGLELLLTNANDFVTDACHFHVHFVDNPHSIERSLDLRNRKTMMLRSNAVKTYIFPAPNDFSTPEAFQQVLRFITKKAAFTNAEITSVGAELLTILADAWIVSGLRNFCFHAPGGEPNEVRLLLHFLNVTRPSEIRLRTTAVRMLPFSYLANSTLTTVTKLEIETDPKWKSECSFGDEHLQVMTNLRQLGLKAVLTQLTAKGLLKWALAHFQAETDVILLCRIGNDVVPTIRSDAADFIVKDGTHKIYELIPQCNSSRDLLEVVQGDYKLKIGRAATNYNCDVIRIKTFREPSGTKNCSNFEIRTEDAVRRAFIVSSPLQRLEMRRPCLENDFVLTVAHADFVESLLTLLCPTRTCRQLYFLIDENRHKLRRLTPDKVLVEFCADDPSGLPAFELTLTNAKRFRRIPLKIVRVNSKIFFSDRHMIDVTEANSTLFEDFRNIFKFITKKAEFRKAQINTSNVNILTILAEEWKTSGIPYFCYDQSQDGISESLLNFLNIIKPEQFKLRRFAPENLPSTFFTESFWSALKTFKIRPYFVSLKCSFGDEELQAITSLRELDLRQVFTPRLTADGLLSWGLARLKAQKTAFLWLRVSKNVYDGLLSRAAALKWPMQEDERELFYSQGEFRLEIHKLSTDNRWDQLRVEILMP